MKKIFDKAKVMPLLLVLALFVMAAGQAAPVFAANARELRFYAFDVGQGDSSLFIFPSGESMLIDAGTGAAASKLIRQLKQYGIKKIDVLVATHPHSDHIGGMGEVLDRFVVGEVWDSGYAHGSDLQIKFYRAIRDRGILFGRPKRGYVREIGGATVEVLGPAAEQRGTSSDANNNSVVLRVTYGEVSFLMAGDMEKAERLTIAPFPPSTVLKAAHHGSRTGTDAKLLREAGPLVIIFSYGRDNPYGHPHQEVLKLLAANPSIKRFDTADGTVKLRTDGKKLSFSKNREVMTSEQKD